MWALILVLVSHRTGLVTSMTTNSIEDMTMERLTDPLSLLEEVNRDIEAGVPYSHPKPRRSPVSVNHDRQNSEASNSFPMPNVARMPPVFDQVPRSEKKTTSTASSTIQESSVYSRNMVRMPVHDDNSFAYDPSPNVARMPPILDQVPRAAKRPAEVENQRVSPKRIKSQKQSIYSDGTFAI